MPNGCGQSHKYCRHNTSGHHEPRLPSHPGCEFSITGGGHMAAEYYGNADSAMEVGKRLQKSIVGWVNGGFESRPDRADPIIYERTYAGAPNAVGQPSKGPLVNVNELDSGLMVWETCLALQYERGTPTPWWPTLSGAAQFDVKLIVARMGDVCRDPDPGEERAHALLVRYARLCIDGVDCRLQTRRLVLVPP